MIRLIAGLGNPGPQYEATRHNAGFWFVDQVAQTLKVSLVPDRSFFGLTAKATTAFGPLWLLEPMTYMNLSGKSVAALARFFKIEPGEVLVAHDELDLMAGQTRLKIGGSHAGHNGLKDIQAQLGSADFWRLRLGIGHPGVRAEVLDHVLRKPPAAEREAIDQGIERSLSALETLLGGQMEQARMRINAGAAQSPRPAKQNRPPVQQASRPPDTDSLPEE